MNGPESLQGFFRELRRRKVVRVIIVYVMVAWSMIEVSKTGAEVLQLPTWTPRLVFMMFLLGFPLAVVLAWAYELTPEGLRRTESAPEEPARRPLASAAVGGTGRTVASRRPTSRREPGRLTTGEMRALAVPDAAQLRRATLASLRHELRTPLTAVVGYSEMLLGRSSPPAGGCWGWWTRCCGREPPARRSRTRTSPRCDGGSARSSRSRSVS